MLPKLQLSLSHRLLATFLILTAAASLGIFTFWLARQIWLPNQCLVERAFALQLWVVLAVAVWILSKLWLPENWWRWSNLRAFFTKPHIFIISVTFFSMLIASNQAWFNPRPDFKPELRLSDSIPIWWQYNMDSPAEILSAAHFPYFFKELPLRINRPLYPALTWAISGLVYVAARPFGEISPLARTIPAHFILKLIACLAFGFVAYRLLREFIGEIPALAAVGLALSSNYAIDYFAKINTSEIHFITPVFVAWFLLILSRDYSTTKNLIFSMVIGLLLLARPNYSSYLAALLFGVINRRFKESLLSFVIASLPLVVWILLLNLFGLNYRFASIQDNGHLSWFGLVFLSDSPILVVQNLLTRIIIYIRALFGDTIAGIAIFSMAYYYLIKEDKERGYRGIFIYFALSLLVNFAQYLAVDISHGRMCIDLHFWLFGFAAYALVGLLGGDSISRQKQITTLIIIFSYSAYIITKINFPWVSPFDQLR